MVASGSFERALKESMSNVLQGFDGVDKLSYEHRQLKLCGSSLDFEFIRDCRKIYKIRPKFQFWTKIEIKMTYLVFVFCYLLSIRL